MNKELYTLVRLWVARDKDGYVYFYKNKPKKGDEEWLPEAECRQYLPRYEEEFRSVHWEDEEPTEIEIYVKPNRTIVERHQVGRDVYSLLDLECVRYVGKENGKTVVFLKLSEMIYMDFRAYEGDWICKTKSGKWLVEKGGES